jgi:hypothetical protein
MFKVKTDDYNQAGLTADTWFFAERLGEGLEGEYENTFIPSVLLFGMTHI